MSGVKREAEDQGNDNDAPKRQRQGRLKEEEDVPDEAASQANVRVEEGATPEQINAILQRLDRLEQETKRWEQKTKTLELENANLTQQVKRLQACVPTTLVEFKFASLKTRDFWKNNQWKGVLHVPMLQDPVSGVCTVRPGTTKVQGQYTDAGGIKTESFVGELKRKNLNTPVHQFRLGINLVYHLEDTVITHLKPATKSCKTEHDAVSYLDREKISEQSCTTGHVVEFVARDNDMMRKWEEDAGGVLSFYAPASFEIDPEFYEEQTGNDASEVVNEAKHKIKLCTVLSA